MRRVLELVGLGDVGQPLELSKGSTKFPRYLGKLVGTDENEPDDQDNNEFWCTDTKQVGLHWSLAATVC